MPQQTNIKASERLDWLHKEISDLVSRYQTEASRYKNNAFRLKITSVFLAGTISVLLGLKFKTGALPELFTNLALCLSAVISVLSAYEAFFDPRSLWVRETVTFVRLKDLQRDLRFWSTGREPEAIDSETLDAFKARLDAILFDTLRHWVKLRGAADVEKHLEARADLRKPAESTQT